MGTETYEEAAVFVIPKTEPQSDNGVCQSGPLRRRSGKSSPVWRYFSVKDGNRALCSICNVYLKYLNRGTSNLTKHLRSKHAIDLSQVLTSNLDAAHSKILFLLQIKLIKL